jgi:two-component system CheB/CheR fusion protein
MERQALFDDMLINVTGFFREPATFAIIQEKVLPNLIKHLNTNNLLRVWVPGCSTGEEAYSVAIALTECLQENGKINIQIFGTDVNSKNIEKARRGIYLKTIEDRVSGSQLEKYFVKINGNYQITKSIRDKCVFAKHDITQDPPFSNLDLIVCRNVLIYIDSPFQEKIIPIFNYALKPDGYLILGESESVGKFTNMFEPIAKRGPVFRKKSEQPRIELPMQSSAPYSQERPLIKSQKASSAPTLKEEVDQLLLDQYVPATLLVNDNSDILVIRGQVNPFISIEPGTPIFSVPKIIRKELRPAIQTAIYRTKKSKKDIQETVRFEDENKSRTVNIRVKHLKTSKEEEPYFLIFLDETVKSTLEEQKKKGQLAEVSDRAKDQQQIKELSEDLETTKQTLQSVIEQQEATNEELRSANEEVQSSNEELMSTNEELETSKEELQSTNEELNTLNDELNNRNQNLAHLNDDLNNLMNNVDTAVVIVDNEFKIKRFTGSAQELLRLTPSDIDHPITGLRLGIPVDDLQEPLSGVISKLTIVRQEINTSKGQWFQMRIRPYITEDKKIGGAVISFANITEMKKWENEKKRYADNLEDQVREQTAKVLQSENLASIGKTAAMVGHDIRNPLQSMMGELYLMTSEVTGLPDGEEKQNLKESIVSLNQNLSYISKIVADLQDYARTPTIMLEEVEVEKVFQDVLSYATLPKEVVASIFVDKDLPKLKLDPSALKRILTNLVSNAVQAMPNGGKLLVSAVCQQDTVIISVEDTGDGISEEAKAKIFSPMFTTKAKGQGFGLVVVKKITEAMGGTIKFESEKGKGTKFILTFPIIK